MPTCDDHYQSVENTTIKCQTKRDRGDKPVVTFFNEDNLFLFAFHVRPGEPSVAAPPTKVGPWREPGGRGSTWRRSATS